MNDKRSVKIEKNSNTRDIIITISSENKNEDLAKHSKLYFDYLAKHEEIELEKMKLDWQSQIKLFFCIKAVSIISIVIIFCCFKFVK